MAIFRVYHDKNNPYVSINSFSLRQKMSWGATGLLAYMLTFKDDWKFHSNRMASEKDETIYNTRKYIKELVTHGYAIRFQENNPHRGEMQYLIFETCFSVEDRVKIVKEKFVNPYFPDIKSADKTPSTSGFKPESEKPNAVKPDTADRELSNINLKEISKEQTNKTPEGDVVVVRSAEDKEKHFLLSQYPFDPFSLKSLMSFPLNQIQDALNALEQRNSIEVVSNPCGWLRSAIIGKWKPNQKKLDKADLEAQKQNAQDKIYRDNLVLAAKLISQWQPKFTGDYSAKISDKLIEVKCKNSYSAISLFDENACVILLFFFEQNLKDDSEI